MQTCGVCLSLALEPARASGVVGLWTADSVLISAASERLAISGSGETHVLVAVCPEHVVDIYRGRVPGVAMAWKLGPAAAERTAVG